MKVRWFSLFAFAAILLLLVALIQSLEAQAQPSMQKGIAYTTWCSSGECSDPDADLHGSAVGNTSGTIRDTLLLTPTVWLPIVMNKWPPPSIEFTYVPPWGSFADLRGQVKYVTPSEYRVAVYIRVWWGWYNKPTWDSPLTSIQQDGSWRCDITTGGIDEEATIIAAFLVPDGYDPPLLGGNPTLPPELYEDSVAYTHVERTRRTLTFSGYVWKVKFSDDNMVGPGPNYFSDRAEDVWVDENGRLHLKIVKRGGTWYCTEVFTQAPSGYGKYVFYLASRVDQLDKNAVLGLFTWDSVTPPAHHYREIDIEFSRWGNEANDNAQYVVQPDPPHRFNLELSGDNSTHGFNWRANSIFFQSFQGHQAFPVPEGDAIESWSYTGNSIPPAGEGNARINLWLYNGSPPSDDKEVEVVIEGFEFVPQ